MLKWIIPPTFTPLYALISYILRVNGPKFTIISFPLEDREPV